MQLWDSLCWPHVNPLPSGAVGKDCQRRLLSRPRFVRACSARDLCYFLYLFSYPNCLIKNLNLWNSFGLSTSNHLWNIQIGCFDFIACTVPYTSSIVLIGGYKNSILRNSLGPTAIYEIFKMAALIFPPVMFRTVLAYPDFQLPFDGSMGDWFLLLVGNWIRRSEHTQHRKSTC
jgi:hypothetical protein